MFDLIAMQVSYIAPLCITAQAALTSKLTI